MKNRPKRRRYKDNPYFLSVDDNNMKYVSFNDSNNELRKIRIEDSIFNAFNQFELDDLSEMNEFDNHIEHSEIIDNDLYGRANIKPLSVEEQAIKNILLEKILDELNYLSDIQKRRFIKYYIYDFTLEEISKSENCTKMAVKFSIDLALKKIRKNLNEKNDFVTI